MRSLGKLKVARGGARIGACLAHPQRTCARRARPRLARSPTPRLKFLEPVLDDPDPEVRKNARWAMQQIVSRKGALGS